MSVLVPILAILVVAPAAWLWGRAHRSSRMRALQAQVDKLRALNQHLQQELSRAEDLAQAHYAELRDEQQARVAAETRLQDARQQREEERQLLADATTGLKDTFRALSSDALERNNETFLQLARHALRGTLSQARGDFFQHQQGLERLIAPLRQALQVYQTHLRELEHARERDQGVLQQQLQNLHQTQELLRNQAAALAGALRTPRVRGRWGEITLRRVVELAGMSPYCDFQEQATVPTDDGVRRPDLVVRLPQERTVVVDAKTPLNAYMEATESSREDARRRGFRRHARAVRAHVRTLASKAYWDQFSPGPDFVILFLPGESFFSAALDHDPDLIEDALNRRVILATPVTLITLLRTIASVWHDQRLTENSQRIGTAAAELFDRMCTFAEHVQHIHDGLDRATRAYNQALGCWERRVLPGARRLHRLGLHSSKDMPRLDAGEERLRTPSSDVSPE